ncbi:hypothetical protein Moror_16156 [Moniliophthora roreri MCA 2997]|uniref:F-box domain-containing protein n=2 Tax=Moniliophthora roreri TaxID=221103 RepID=V2X6P6_MONRO|nr:hypothetical protein Moror_16156 [Moniliophthora roreri MCA 2997]
MQLAQELVDKIIAEHKDSPRDLKACSLIGRAWVTQTRRPGYLFSTLPHMNDEQLNAFIRFFLDPTSCPFTLQRGCVQKMSLEKPLHSYEFCGMLPTCASASTSARTRTILDVLGGIDTLDLRVIDAFDWMDYSSTNPRARTLPFFTSLRTLNLRNIRFGSAEHFLDIINSLPSLEILTWQNAKGSASPFLVCADKNARLSPRNKLHTITICLHMFTPALTAVTLRLCTQIRTWTLLELDQKDFNVLCKLFREAGRRGVPKQEWTLRAAARMEQRMANSCDLASLRIQAEKAVDLESNTRVAKLVFYGKSWSVLLSSYVYQHLTIDGLNNAVFNDL